MLIPIQNELIDLRETIQNHMIDLRETMIDLRETIKSGFGEMHYFGRNRIKTLKLVTSEIQFSNCNGASTSHTFFYKGYVGEIFAPHFNCSRSFIPNLSNGTILHETHDLGIIAEFCPRNMFALNITQYTVPELGDEVISFGFGNSANAWSGIVSGVTFKGNDSLHQHWEGAAKICSGEYIVQAAQHAGMSGSAASNGCGYLGMAHIVSIQDKANFAVIIGAKVIADFLDKNLVKLKSFDECSNLKILQLPIIPFIECYKNEIKVDYIEEFISPLH